MEAWVLSADGQYEQSARVVRQAIERKRDCEGVYDPLCRGLFAAGRYQEVASIADAALDVSGEDYNIYVPIANALGALGKDEAARNVQQRRVVALETRLKNVPEDPRARMHLATLYAAMDRADDAVRETNLAITLRGNEATVLYNAACVFCLLKRKPEALDATRKAWDAGFKDSD